MSGHGYGTYRLRVLLPKTEKLLSVKSAAINTAFNLFLNDELLGKNGQVSLQSVTSVPGRKSEVFVFYTDKSELEIIMQISNYHSTNGGFTHSFKVGTEKQISSLRENALSFEQFLFGSLLIMSLYHLTLYLLRRKDNSALYFSLFSLIIAIRVIVTGETFISKFFPDIPFQIQIKLEYLSFYAAVPVFFMYLQYLFFEEFKMIVLRIGQAVTGIFCLIILFTDMNTFSRTLNAFQVIALLTGMYDIYVLVLATILKREGSFSLLLGMLVFFVTFVNDVLHDNYFINTGFYVPFGVFIFVFAQAFVLSKRFSKAFLISESLNTELIDLKLQLESNMNLSVPVKNVKGAHAFAYKAKKAIFFKKIKKSGIAKEELFVIETGKLESYLMIPLILRNEPIGFLDLFNINKMNLQKEDITRLSILGDQVAGAIHTTSLLSQVDEEGKKSEILLMNIRRDLQVARKIQQAILPPKLNVQNLKIFSKYIPMNEVGGDIYDITKLQNGNVRVFLADATGHGVQAALVTMCILAEYQHIKEFQLQPSELLASLNTQFCRNYVFLKSYFTCLLMDIDLKANKITFASAGHPPQVLLRKNTMELLHRSGPLIGVKDNINYKLTEMEFQKDDKIFLFTDGAFEEFNSRKEEFGEERLYKLINEYRQDPIDSATEKILTTLSDSLDDRQQQDDITVLAFEYS